MSIAPSNTGFEIRPARREDLGAIHAMIRELAAYEKLLHLCVSTEPELDLALFGPEAAAEVLIATKADKAAAFALFFHNFSTFVGRRGLWLEDLYVRPEFRRQGCAHAMLQSLAGIARARNCGRFEWAVLDWNTPAIDFYQALGAVLLPDWRLCRVVGDALAALAEQGPPAPLPD